MRIPIVEDETLVAFAIEWALKLARHQVLGPADSVEAAITLCTNARSDVALIDAARQGLCLEQIAHQTGASVDVVKQMLVQQPDQIKQAIRRGQAPAAQDQATCEPE